MNVNATSGQERTDLEVTVCSNGVVNVHRPESDRAHSVIVVGGDVVRCSCKGHRFHGHCAHQDAVEARPLVVSSASAAAASPVLAIATDGGERVEDTDSDGARDVSPCPGCGSLTVDDTCGRDRCEGADEIDTTPL